MWWWLWYHGRNHHAKYLIEEVGHINGRSEPHMFLHLEGDITRSPGNGITRSPTLPQFPVQHPLHIPYFLAFAVFKAAWIMVHYLALQLEKWHTQRGRILWQNLKRFPGRLIIEASEKATEIRTVAINSVTSWSTSGVSRWRVQLNKLPIMLVRRKATGITFQWKDFPEPPSIQTHQKTPHKEAGVQGTHHCSKSIIVSGNILQKKMHHCRMSATHYLHVWEIHFLCLRWSHAPQNRNGLGLIHSGHHQEIGSKKIESLINCIVFLD